MRRSTVLSIDWERLKHIKDVFARFAIFSESSDFTILRAALPITPTYFQNRGDVVFYREKEWITQRSAWTLSSRSLGVESKNANDHLRAIVSTLEPVRSLVVDFVRENESLFEVTFSAVNLEAAPGLVFEPSVLQEVATFESDLAINLRKVSRDWKSIQMTPDANDFR
jgi:hypothetical protein